MRRLHVANVGDGVAAELRRARHAPTHHEQFAIAVFYHSYHGREVVWEDVVERWDVARVVEVDSERRRMASWLRVIV